MDPGWGPAVQTFVVSYFSLGLAGRKRQKDLDGLTITRILFLSLVLAGFLVVFVMSVIIPSFGDIETPLAIIVVVQGLAGVAGASWARNRPLDVSDAQTLAGSYRTLFFLGFSLSETPLLIAVAITFLTDDLWPVIIAFPFFVIAMALSAPGVANLARHQQRITAAGSSLSLVSALMQPPRPRSH